MEQAPPLPDLWKGCLDDKQLQQYMVDLETHAEIFCIQIKLSPHQMVTSEPGHLRASIMSVMSGDIFAVQLRYGYLNREWCDTLMKRGEVINLIRVSYETNTCGHESSQR